MCVQWQALYVVQYMRVPGCSGGCPYGSDGAAISRIGLSDGGVTGDITWGWPSATCVASTGRCWCSTTLRDHSSTALCKASANATTTADEELLADVACDIEWHVVTHTTVTKHG